MLWRKDQTFQDEPFETESDLETAIREVAAVLFGENRIYLDPKRKIGAKGKTRNIPDGYLLDLTSAKEPTLYVVENELAKHDPLKHIAVQILEFSLSFETTPHQVKNILKDAIAGDTEAVSLCQTYAEANGFENIDVLLERMIYRDDGFHALVIIDEVSEELEKALMRRFQFPVEILTVERYVSADGERLFRFDPFLSDVSGPQAVGAEGLPKLDPAVLDTIVVPARSEGFRETFLGENRWYAIRIHSSMIPKIKHIAAYQVAPESAITHIAKVASIERWKDTSKYVINFAQPAIKIGPIRLTARGIGKGVQSPRYTSRERLEVAKNVEQAF